MLIRYIWTPLGRRSDLCLGFVARWFGATKRNCDKLLALLEACSTYDIDLSHGLTFLKLIRGKTSLVFRQQMNDAIEVFTRSSADSNYRVCTNTDVSGVADIYRRAKKVGVVLGRALIRRAPM